MADNTTPIEGGNQNLQQGSQSGYTPPASQEDLDRIIGERVARERAKYSDYQELKQKATRLQQIEDAGKSEADKAADQIKALSDELAGYKHREQTTTWATEVATAGGRPDLADLLDGASKDDIQAKFDRLKDRIPAPGENKPKRTPVPPGSPGASDVESRAVAALRELRRQG